MNHHDARWRPITIRAMTANGTSTGKNHADIPPCDCSDSRVDVSDRRLEEQPPREQRRRHEHDGDRDDDRPKAELDDQRHDRVDLDDRREPGRAADQQRDQEELWVAVPQVVDEWRPGDPPPRQAQPSQRPERRGERQHEQDRQPHRLRQEGEWRHRQERRGSGGEIERRHVDRPGVLSPQPGRRPAQVQRRVGERIAGREEAEAHHGQRDEPGGEGRVADATPADAPGLHVRKLHGTDDGGCGTFELVRTGTAAR